MGKEQEKGLGVRPGQVISAALAAVTAAVLGSTMGLAGTVIGAGLASVVTTIAGALYLHSLDRTKAGVRLVRERVRSGVTDEVIIEREIAEEPEQDEAVEPGAADRPPVRRGLRWGAIVAGSALAFVLGMLAITGYEQLTGGSLSGGDGTTVGGVLHEQSNRQQQQQREDAPTSTTTPPPATVTVTVPADPTTSSGSSVPSTSQPPTTTTTPDSTTGAPPSTTTTTPNGDIPSQ